MERINFPLKGVLAEYGGDTEWSYEQWPLMKWHYEEIIENSQDSISTIKTDSTFYFGEFCRNCGFSFWMEFKVIQDKWMLIERQENNY